MAFNSYSYHANREARQARDYLRQARERKAQGRDPLDIAHCVRLARSCARSARIYRQLRQLQRERMAI